MKYKQLSEEDKEYLRYIYFQEDMSHDEKMEVLSSKFDSAPRTIRNWWREKLNLSKDFTNLPPQLAKARDRAIPDNTDILLVTSAQNKTGVHKKAIKNIEAYADFLRSKGFKTEIVVTPSRYRNPTSPIEGDRYKTEEWWVDEVKEYLTYGKIKFGDTIISSDSRVRPTAKEPLTGYELMASDNHLVISHPKIHFKTLPRFKNKPLRTMLTTGFITYKNYSDSKAGDLAYENHSYGFVVLEKRKDGTCSIPRNVKITSNGDFTDIFYHTEDGKTQQIDSSEGFVWGDIHTEVVNKKFVNVTLDLIKNKIKPKKQVLHDVFDGSTVNPHETKDLYIRRKKIKEGKYLIEKEIDECLNLIEKIDHESGDTNTYVALSNHDVFLDRMVNDLDWKKDLHNSPMHLKLAYLQQTLDLEEYGCLMGYLISKEFGGLVRYINYGESLDICGYESGSHGDFGANGAKGSYKTFSRLNTKMIHGHGHSPVIHNGVTMVGVTCKLDQYYNRRGLSSWAYAHSVIHNNGKNQLLVFNDDLSLSVLF